MPTKYLAKPYKGRVGKSRQVEAIVIEVDSLPHDLDKIETAIEKAFYKYAYHAYAVATTPGDTSSIRVDLYQARDHNHLAAIRVDQIEE